MWVKLKNQDLINTQCLTHIIGWKSHNVADWTVTKAYRGISSSINVISVSVWQLDSVNMQQLVGDRSHEANLLAMSAWYQFNFLMRWRSLFGLILFASFFNNCWKTAKHPSDEFRASQYRSNLVSAWPELNTYHASIGDFLFNRLSVCYFSH